MSGKSQIDATETPAETPANSSSSPGEDRVIGARINEIFRAVGLMTRLPVPFRPGNMARAMWAVPIAGALVGVLAGGALWGAALLGLPDLACALLALAVGAFATGALHEDGLADCADGFWGGATPSRRLEIMRDSRSGAYGVLALVLATGLKASLLATLLANAGPEATVVAVIAVQAVARAGLPGLMAVIHTPSETGLAASVGRPGSRVAIVSGILGLALTAPLILVGMPIAPIALGLASGLACLAMGILARRKLGGVNGDSLGAAEQVAEIACLISLVALSAPE